MKEKGFDPKIRILNNDINNYSQIVKVERVLNDKNLTLNNIKYSIIQRTIENSQTRYTISAIIEKIKKDLAIVTFDVTGYLLEIKKQNKSRYTNHRYYDYDLELDFSIDTQCAKNIDNKIYDDRWYYYKAHHFLKLGLFLKKDVPAFKIKISDLSPEIIYELTELDYEDRKFVLKQAVSRIFEDINYDLYHDSISSRLEVVIVDSL